MKYTCGTKIIFTLNNKVENWGRGKSQMEIQIGEKSVNKSTSSLRGTS